MQFLHPEIKIKEIKGGWFEPYNNTIYAYNYY